MRDDGWVDEEEHKAGLRVKAERYLAALRAGTLGPADMQSAIVACGKAGLVEARPDVARFLKDDDAGLRRAALMVLAVDFGLGDYAAVARDFLLGDPDVYCRMIGATALGALRADSLDAETLAVLARVVRDEREDPYVRRAAYGAMKAVLRYLPREQFAMATTGFRFPEDVDWALVDVYAEDDDRA